MGIILKKNEIQSWLKNFRKIKRKLVFTNGCFDILHVGHITYLEKAKNFGDALFVGINSNNSIKKIKGINRPVNDQNDRAIVLKSIESVDVVTIFDEETPENLIKEIAPDYLVKGGDYNPNKIVGYNKVTSYGGKVKIISYVEGFSSTNIIKKIKENL